MNKTKRITLATFKSFMKKNEGKLFIQCISSFDGMTDCVEYAPKSARVFKPIEKRIPSEHDYIYGIEKGRTREEIEARTAMNENTLGYHGIWLVRDSRDSFTPYEDDQFIGYDVYNCCGSFIVATPKRI